MLSSRLPARNSRLSHALARRPVNFAPPSRRLYRAHRFEEWRLGQDMQPIIEDRHDLVELVNRLRFIAKTLKNLPDDHSWTCEQIEKLSRERKIILAYFREVRPFRKQKAQAQNRNKL